MRKITYTILLFLLFIGIGFQAKADSPPYYKVTNVIDGDTIGVLIDGKTRRVRLIGIDAPGNIEPTRIKCFGREASDKARQALDGRYVLLEKDKARNNVDMYGRLLRYVILEDGTNFNLSMVLQGYAREYTYHGLPYEYQRQFRQAETFARQNKLGVWSDLCQNQAFPETLLSSNTKYLNTCDIKGNINYRTQEKIYHTPECDSYARTFINEDRGERWFCSEREAIDEGWRKALNC